MKSGCVIVSVNYAIHNEWDEDKKKKIRAKLWWDWMVLCNPSAVANEPRVVAHWSRCTGGWTERPSTYANVDHPFDHHRVACHQASWSTLLCLAAPTVLWILLVDSNASSRQQKLAIVAQVPCRFMSSAKLQQWAVSNSEVNSVDSSFYMERSEWPRSSSFEQHR